MHIRTLRNRAGRDARAEDRAQAEREAGIPDRGPDDCRVPAQLDLRPFGGPLLTARPVQGKIAWAFVDEDAGCVVLRATAKEALHALADRLPRQLGARSFG